MIEGDPENVDAKYRTEFSVKALEDAGLEVNQLDDQVGNWDQATAQQLVANDLSQFGDDVEVVFCNNDAMALGALQSIEAAGRTVGDNIFLVGVDALSEALDKVEEGKMTGTVFNDHISQSHSAADAAVKYLAGEENEHYIGCDYVKVTTDNVADIKEMTNNLIDLAQKGAGDLKASVLFCEKGKGRRNMSEYKLQLKGVCKSFPGVKALDNVQLSLRPGTVHALMGENGAGKSTLMKCLFGIYKMDAGEVYLDGQKIVVNNPDEAMKYGIAMVHQELQPVPARTVAENLYLGRFPTKKYGPLQVIDHKKMYEDTAYWLKEVKMDFDPKALLGDLSIGQMQSVEIAKAVSHNAKVVIFDEPTSSLSDNEVEALFRIMNDLRDKGVAMVYISHKMDEIKRIADDITIMRDGTYVGTWPAAEMTTEDIINQMVGRELTNVYPEKRINREK